MEGLVFRKDIPGVRKVPSNTFQGRAASGRVAGQGGLNSKEAGWEPDEDTSRRLHGLASAM